MASANAISTYITGASYRLSNSRFPYNKYANTLTKHNRSLNAIITKKNYDILHVKIGNGHFTPTSNTKYQTANFYMSK